MIYNLLLHRFPIEYSLDPQKVKLDCRVCSSDFILTDPKACDSCQSNSQRKNRMDCNREVLKVYVENDEVTVINLEEYLGQYKFAKEKCDYLLVDNTENHRKISFCDLTCSDEKYVEPNKGVYSAGKRVKAKHQMVQSMEYLLDESLFAQFILTFAQKHCVFGWRDYNVPAVSLTPSRNNVLGNMQAFGITPSSMAKEIKTQERIKEHDFIFVQVKYPNEYVW